MRVPESLSRVMLKLGLIEYVPVCKFSDNCCLEKHEQQPDELEPLEEVLLYLDLTNVAMDRWIDHHQAGSGHIRSRCG